jgi:hypothetical protein
MIKRIFIIIFLLSNYHSKSQFISTIFIDTLNVTVANKNIHISSATKLKFIPNTMDCKVIIYEDGKYKFELSFDYKNNNVPINLIISGYRLYINDTIFPLMTEFFLSDFQQCLETHSGYFILKNSTASPYKIRIKLSYKLMNYAPIDTTNYTLNYKQGLWVGSYDDANKVTVYFEKDKRNGLAKALYSDGSSYNVIFKDDVPDNYGRGNWAYYDKRSKFKFSYTIPPILGACYNSKSNSYSHFAFQRGNKYKEVLSSHDLSVHYEKKGFKNDSLQFHVRGDFINITNDSMIIQTEELDMHDFYKTNIDSLHRFSKQIETGFVKVPLSAINKIFYERSDWKTFTLRTTILSLACALVVSPLISVQKGGFNSDRFSKVTTASLGVAVLSISFGIAFSQKEFLLKSSKKKNKPWVIRPFD